MRLTDLGSRARLMDRFLIEAFPDVGRLPQQRALSINSITNMLWLNPITFFFHNLSNNSQESNYDVAVWAKDIHNAQRRPSKRLRSDSSATLISKRSALASGAVVVRTLKGGDEDEAKGLSDRDERYCAERDDAVSSPIKPAKVRATSTVSVIVSSRLSFSFNVVAHFHQVRTPREPTKEQ